MIETAEATHRPSSAFRPSFANMLFKRKPVGDASMQVEPIEKEVRQRHRLSKPQTSKSSMNLAVLALQQSASQSTISVQSEVPMSPITSTPLSHERYVSERRPVSTVQEEDFIFNTDSSEMPSHGPAVVIDAVENKDIDRSSIPATLLQVQKPRRPFSAMIFGSRRSSAASRKFSFEDMTQTGEVANTSQVLSAPVEIVIEGAPRVLERRASFTPGAATRLEKVQSRDSGVPARKPVPKPQIRKEPSYELANATQHCEVDQAYYYDKARSPISPLSQLEVLDFEKDWEPPAQIERSATPSDLDYHYLGGLRLGSLHVTNGRASPAPSELSRHLLHRPSALLRRDASSEYGSEVGSVKRTHTPPPSAWKRPQSREVSQSRNFSPQSKPQPSREVSYGSDYAFTAQSHANGDDLPSPTADRTVSMAMSYMAEMPNSPFSLGASQSNSPVTPKRTSSPTGSVVVTTKKSEHEAELFEDETIGESQGSEEDRDTISTCRTPSDAASHRQNPFDTYNKLRDRQSQGHLQPPQDARGETSDSGYSSNTSLQSMKEEKKRNLVAQRVTALEQPRAESAAAQLPASTQKSKVEKVVGPRPFRASLFMFHRKTAPETVPTMASFNGSTTSLATSQATTSTFSLRPKTPSKKLQKKRRGSQAPPPEEILVAGAQSEDNSTIPPIPQHQTTNLMVRSQQFPELQRTFKSNHHTKDSAGSYDQTWKKPMEIRFPSPPPDPSSDEEVRRSKSPSPKRSSFIARATRRQSLQSQKSGEQASGGIGEAEAQAIVRHFGTTAKSLGGSPYDIARVANSRPQSRSASREGRISPHDIDVTQPPFPVPDRRRLTMDDRTASEYARSKSKSIAERDRQYSVENSKRLEHEKTTAFSGMAGIPSKCPRPHSVQPGLMASVHRKPLEGQRLFHDQGPHSREHTPRPAELASEARPESQLHSRRYADLPQQTGLWPQQQRQLQVENFQTLPGSRSPRPEQHQYTQRHESAAPQEQQWPEEQYLAQSYQSPMQPPSRRSPQPNEEQYRQSYEFPAPLPPRHSPRPSFVEPYHDMDEPTAPPPPPPSHSPRPIDLPTSSSPGDVWAAQAAAWKDRRKIVGEFLGFDSDDLHCPDTDRHSAYTDDAVVEDDPVEDDPEEELYPVIPPRVSQTAYTPHEDHSPCVPSHPNVWHPAAHHHAETYDIDLSRMTPAEKFQDPAAYTYDELSLPSPRSNSRRASGQSYASSMAESLHPSKDARPSVPPDFGRYSGGLQYGYERGKGFGGSAGTRTVSGRAQGERKGVELSTEFGVDLSDVPIVRGVRRL
jgi:hypothetical protein